MVATLVSTTVAQDYEDNYERDVFYSRGLEDGGGAYYPSGALLDAIAEELERRMYLAPPGVRDVLPRPRPAWRRPARSRGGAGRSFMGAPFPRPPTPPPPPPPTN
ncbi:hypothetical protein FA15DRAFT_656496 [Coprinopsis marcescibilis]|uniref:Uncharacterized protein n=1 Tax=Coprinopsis marcescibilis TaxID=230819 RepID=A0A5C3L6B5_COPMA|nr:hypothetical protein FA15DRAFT_656496 [Coprinopsis marcescibilis]